MQKPYQTPYSGFLSYVHADNESDSGRIIELAQDLKQEYEMLSGSLITLFVDRDSLEWGTDWQAKIDESLESMAFFMPILTPRYFQSPACNRELKYAVRRMKSKNLERLILPIHYVHTPILTSGSQNEMADLLSGVQWQDWRELRLEERASSAYRKKISEMADNLLQSNRWVQSNSAVSIHVENENSDEGDDELGTLDSIALIEEKFPAWTETMKEMTPSIEKIGEIFKTGSKEVEKPHVKAAGFGGRVRILREMAEQLEDPTQKISENAATFTSYINEIDLGFRPLIDQIALEYSQDPNSNKHAFELLHQLEDLSSVSRESFGKIENLIDQIRPMEKLSRDLRRPLRELRQSLLLMTESTDVISSWHDKLRDVLPRGDH